MLKALRKVGEPPKRDPVSYRLFILISVLYEIMEYLENHQEVHR